MAQSGYTPILIYASGTTGNTPSSSNLTSSSSGAELALNYYDGKLFYKDSGGTVQVLAGKGGTGVVAGSNTQIQFNNNGVFGASSGLTWDGSFLTATSIKDSALTSGRVTFAGASGLLTDSSGLTWDGTTFAASNISTGGSVTLSGGTANGVLYLNGSKVATSGSALTFDGTTFATTGRTSSANGAWVASGAVMGWGAAGTFSNYIVGDTTSNYLLFQVNSAEGMRLTSTGLGIGTSSPVAKLEVYTAGTVNLRLNGSLVGGNVVDFYNYIPSVANNGFSIAVGGTLRAIIDSSGNLGLDVAPGTWAASAKAIEFTFPTYGMDAAGSAFMSFNARNSTGSTWVYKSTDEACKFTAKTDGSFIWETAPSGTAGNAITFTQAMTLDASGNLGVGTSSPAAKLEVYNSAVNGAFVANTPSTWRVAQIRNDQTSTSGSAAGIAFVGRTDTKPAGIVAINENTTGGIVSLGFLTVDGNQTFERMRLDSSGNLGLGVTPSASWSATCRVFQFGTYSAVNENFGGYPEISFNSTQTGSTSFVYRVGTDPATRFSQTNGAFQWFTAPSGTAGNAITFTQAMTLDANGDFVVGDTATNSIRISAVKINPTRGILAHLYNTASSSHTGAQFQFTQNGIANWVIGQPAGENAFAFWSGRNIGADGNERARITSGGKLLVGTTATGGTLTVDGVDAISTSNPATYAITCGNDSESALAFGSDASYVYAQSFGSRQLILNQQGNKILVAATTDNGSYNLQCNGTGVWGAGAYVNGSDERLKDNIKTLDDGLSVVSQLRPVTFQYKPEHSKDQSVQPGFIAQELQQAMAGKDYLDGVVQSGPEYLNVAYQNLIPILTKAIQEQQALITALTARVSQLESQ